MHSQRFTMYLEENIAEKTEYYSQGANMTSRIWVKVFRVDYGSIVYIREQR